MFCPKCGKENADGASFCGSCGAPLKQGAQANAADVPAEGESGAVVASASGNGAKKRGLRKGIIGGIVAVVVIVIAIVVGMNAFGGNDSAADDSKAESTSNVETSEVKPQEESNPAKNLEDYTWDELSKISEEIAKAPDENAAIEVAKKYNLTTKDGKLNGTQTKSVTLSNGVQTAVQIAGFAHDEKADGGKAGITFIFKDSICKHNMYSSNTNAGGWEKSEMRSYLNSEGLSLLPSDLQQKIVSVNKLTNNVGQTQDLSSVTKTVDQFWLFSAVELCGDQSSQHSIQAYIDIQNAEGSEYKLFRDMNVNPARSNNILMKSLNGQSCDWWKRTPDPDHSYIFKGVSFDGNPRSSYDTDYSTGVCPGFCV